MRSIVRPSMTLQLVLDELGGGAEIANLRRISAELLEGETEFSLNAVTGNFRLTETKHPSVLPKDEEDVQWAWKNRLSSGAARDLYDALKAGGGSRCPSCLHRQVHELDHFLPKSKYPRLAIVPYNLVPICSDCNATKRAYVATTGDNEPIHPYFDTFGDEEWLKGTVLPAPGAPVDFSVDPPKSWSDALGERVIDQFERLRLGELYADLATTLMGNFASALEKRFANAGVAGTEAFLLEMLDTWKASNTEPYAVAALTAWSTSPFVWNGGWRL